MLKRTHTIVGMACALTVLQPHSYAEIITATVAGAIGAQVPDIDSATSESHRDADLICLSTALLVCGALYCEYKWNLGLVSRISTNSTYIRSLIGAFILLGVCAYGKETAHRTFMHSLLGLFSTTIGVWFMMPIVTPWYAIGYSSHILIDLLNKKKIQILYPCKKGVGFNICKSNGIINRLIGTLGTILVSIKIYALLKTM